MTGTARRWKFREDYGRDPLTRPPRIHHGTYMCGERLLLQRAGSSAIVTTLELEELRTVGLLQRQAGDQPLPVRAVLEALDAYPTPSRTDARTGHHTRPDALACPACGSPVRRTTLGHGWATARCEGSH